MAAPRGGSRPRSPAIHVQSVNVLMYYTLKTRLKSLTQGTRLTAAKDTQREAKQQARDASKRVKLEAQRARRLRKRLQGLGNEDA